MRGIKSINENYNYGDIPKYSYTDPLIQVTGDIPK